MSELDAILERQVDVKALVETELDLAEETLRSASFTQPKLFEQAARFFVQCMRERLAAEAAFEEYKAARSARFRAKLTSGKRDKPTEKQITEHVVLESKYYGAKQERYNAALEAEAYAKLLLEAFKMRRDMIRSMTGVMDEEARQEFREIRARKAQEEFDDVRGKLKEKYRHVKRGQR